jgi:hypothetical protein
MLKNCCGDHLEESFHAQLKRRTQHTRESPQEFSAVMAHMAHCAHVGLSKQNISREVIHAFTDRVRE